MKGLFQCPPWARSFCPFRACGKSQNAMQGVLGKTKRDAGRVGIKPYFPLLGKLRLA